MTCLRLQVSDEQTGKRALAGRGRTNKAKHFTWLHREGYIAEKLSIDKNAEWMYRSNNLVKHILVRAWEVSYNLFVHALERALEGRVLFGCTYSR